MIRKATLDDLPAIKALLDANKKTFGFVRRSALEEGIKRGWLLVAEHQGVIYGFAHYRHRRDKQTTLYEICVEESSRRQKVGTCLLGWLQIEARDAGQTCILLQTPEDSPANDFYTALGYEHIARLPGKKRALNSWMLTL